MAYTAGTGEGDWVPGGSSVISNAAAGADVHSLLELLAPGVQLLIWQMLSAFYSNRWRTPVMAIFMTGRTINHFILGLYNYLALSDNIFQRPLLSQITQGNYIDDIRVQDLESRK